MTTGTKVIDGVTYNVKSTYTTAEGDVPYKQLIEELKTAKALPNLELDTSTAQKIACDHV